jgi:hypothetical protein
LFAGLGRETDLMGDIIYAMASRSKIAAIAAFSSVATGDPVSCGCVALSSFWIAPASAAPLCLPGSVS